MLADLKIVLNVLDKYYILNDVRDEIKLTYNFVNDKIYLFGNFEEEFISSIDKEKYGILDSEDGYIMNNLEGVLYFYHEYRNYIFGKRNLVKIDILPFMIEDYRKRIISKYKLDISNDEWMLDDSKNCSKYFEKKKNISDKLKILLEEFDQIVNPYSKGINLESISSIKGYISDNERKCIAVETKDDISIRRYLRRAQGFVYKFIANTDMGNINLCHYFNNEGEGISALIDGIKVKYNLNTKVFQINDKDVIMDDEYFICELLMNAIKYYNIEFYKKVKTFK